MGNQNFLVTRVRNDCATTYLYYWAQDSIDFAKERNFHVLELNQDKASRVSFWSYLNKFSPALVFLNGHGSSTLITGHNNEVLLKCADDKSSLVSSIVYALSCSACKKLGKNCVEKGVRAFIGYTSDYQFVTDSDFNTRPLLDKVAALFLEPSNLLVSALIKRNSVDEAFKRSRNMLIRNFAYSLSSKATADQKAAAPYLWHDLKCFTYYGHPNAIV